MREHAALQILAVDLQPVGRWRMRCRVTGGQNSRVVLALLANFDYVVGPYFERWDVDFPAIDQKMTVADELAGLRPAGAQPHAIDDTVEPPLQGSDQRFAGDAFLGRRFFEQVAELPFQQSPVT